METKYVRIPFDVELAKKITSGEAEGKVATRDGNSVRIVCWDALRSDNLVVLITEGAIEKTYNYTPDGRVFINDETSLDLMLEVPEYMAFKDGDIVAFGENNNHVGIFKSLDLKEKTFSSYATLTSKSLVFYEPAWRLINIHIATEEQRQRIVNALKSSEAPKAKECLKKLGIEEKPKCEFKPFDKVLVRNEDGDEWKANIFSNYCEGNLEHKYDCVTYSWKQCIPYIGNEKLLGTTDNPE